MINKNIINKKLFFLALSFYHSLFASSTHYGTTIPCLEQYMKNSEEALKKIYPMVSKDDLVLAKGYIDLVRNREILDKEILILERTTLGNSQIQSIFPQIQGILKRPYDDFANCSELNMVLADLMKIKVCQDSYAQDVAVALDSVKNLLANYAIPQMYIEGIMNSSKRYIELYRDRAIVNAKLLIIERKTVISLQVVAGVLRKSYDIYDQCRDPKSVLLFSY